MFCFLNPHLQGKDSGPEGTLAAFFQGENLERHILASHSGDRTKPDRQIANTGFAEVPTVQSKPPCQISDNCSQKMKESRAALCSSVSPPPATEESGGGERWKKTCQKESLQSHTFLLTEHLLCAVPDPGRKGRRSWAQSLAAAPGLMLLQAGTGLENS